MSVTAPYSFSCFLEILHFYQCFRRRVFIQGLEYFETSAATQQGNLDPFHFMADQFRRKYQEEVNSQGEFERD